MPNIDNSLRNNTYMSRMFEGCSGCVLIDIRKLILSENDLYRCFYDVNPFCVIVVKDNTEKQKVLNSYPNFKQVYTAAEYEENDHLYSHVHVTLYDRSGNLIPEYDGGAHYSLYYYEYYNNDTNS